MRVRTRRLHITGASGSGTTTLGRALADALAIPHHDTDDYYFLPTSPPFQEKRPVEDRLRLMQEVFLDRDSWVLSGSIHDWSGPIEERFDLVVYLWVPGDLRVERLRERETLRFGLDAVSPGGWRHEETEWFLEWASHYDDGTREGRSRPRHEAWLAGLTCPVLRLNGEERTESLVRQALAALG